jgi:hypothetical protein
MYLTGVHLTRVCLTSVHLMNRRNGRASHGRAGASTTGAFLISALSGNLALAPVIPGSRWVFVRLRFSEMIWLLGFTAREFWQQDARQGKFYIQLEVYGVGALKRLTAISCFSVAAAVASHQPAQQVERLQQHHLRLRSPLQQPS